MVNNTYGLLCKIKEVGIFDECVKNGVINATLAYKKQVYETFLSIDSDKKSVKVYDTSVLLQVDPDYVYRVVNLFEK